jgi:hypothetical protein
MATNIMKISHVSKNGILFEAKEIIETKRTLIIKVKGFIGSITFRKNGHHGKDDIRIFNKKPRVWYDIPIHTTCICGTPLNKDEILCKDCRIGNKHYLKRKL